MADPLTIIAGVVGILSSIATLSASITAFGSEVADAKKDMQRVSEELESLALVLSKLQDSYKAAPNSLSPSLAVGLGEVLQNCKKTVVELEILLQKASNRQMKSLNWRLSGKRESNSLRDSLAAHKSTLGLTLILITSISNRRIEENTEEILLHITNIQATLPRTGRSFMLMRYLQDSATYTESIYEGSTITDGALEDLGPDHLSIEDSHILHEEHVLNRSQSLASTPAHVLRQLRAFGSTRASASYSELEENAPSDINIPTTQLRQLSTIQLVTQQEPLWTRYRLVMNSESIPDGIAYALSFVGDEQGNLLCYENIKWASEPNIWTATVHNHQLNFSRIHTTVPPPSDLSNHLTSDYLGTGYWISDYLRTSCEISENKIVKVHCSAGCKQWFEPSTPVVASLDIASGKWSSWIAVPRLVSVEPPTPSDLSHRIRFAIVGSKIHLYYVASLLCTSINSTTGLTQSGQSSNLSIQGLAVTQPVVPNISFEYFSHGNKLFAIKMTQDEGTWWYYSHYDVLYSYDFVSHRWAADPCRGEIPSPMISSLEVLDDTLYVFGERSHGVYGRDLYALSLSQKRWYYLSQKFDSTGPRQFPVCTNISSWKGGIIFTNLSTVLEPQNREDWTDSVWFLNVRKLRLLFDF